jgi:hypothetical protein
MDDIDESHYFHVQYETFNMDDIDGRERFEDSPHGYINNMMRLKNYETKLNR